MDGSDGGETDSRKRDHAADERDAGGERRDIESEVRDGAADVRDSLAATRDQAARLRDRAADDRDEATARMRTAESTTETAPEAFMRQSSAADRKWSSDGRDAAETERQQASDDREHASSNRNASSMARDESAADRGISADHRRVSAQDRASAAMDALTGAYLRGPGLSEIQREMERAVRRASPLVLAFIDVDALKVVNDSKGHEAGDELLKGVVTTLRDKLRAYDRIVRYGGDEFVCALSDMTELDAAARFTDVNASLAAEPVPGSVTFGLATMVAGDSVASLIARADSALYRKRAQK